MKTKGMWAAFPTAHFLGGFVGVLVLGTLLGIVAISLAPAPPPSRVEAEEPSDDLLLKVEESRRRRLLALDAELRALETEAREYFSSFARQAIQVAQEQEVKKARENPFLADPHMRARLKALMIEERRRENLAMVAQSAAVELSQTERMVELGPGQRESVEDVFVRYLLSLQEFQARLPQIPKSEHAAGFRKQEEFLQTEMRKVLSPDQYDRWVTTIGKKYHRIVDFVETVDRLDKNPPVGDRR